MDPAGVDDKVLLYQKKESERGKAEFLFAFPLQTIIVFFTRAGTHLTIRCLFVSKRYKMQTAIKLVKLAHHVTPFTFC